MFQELKEVLLKDYDLQNYKSELLKVCHIKSENFNSKKYFEFSKIHQITAYLAMFPPSLPYYFIKEFTKDKDIVFDPFSGRGTTPFEACRMGRVGVGNDLNPLAYCLTKAKINIPKHKKAIFKRVDSLEANYIKPEICNVSEDIKMLFDEETTLPQLIYLKNNLKISSKIDCFILAILTGLLHGKRRKDGTSIYCSIDMPNTFSMSPNYIKNFVKKHKLTKPRQNVFKLIKNRIDNTFLEYQNKTLVRTEDNDNLKSLNNYINGFAFQKDAIESSKSVIRRFGKNKVKIIFTSPPYLKVINYGKYNWIRLWLLNESKDDVDRKIKMYDKTSKQNLSDNMNLYDYSLYMQKLFNSWDDILKNDGFAFVVIGDVAKKSGSYTNLAEECWKLIEENGGCKLELVEIISDDISEKANLKVTKIWGKKKGTATTIEKIMVLKRK